MSTFLKITAPYCYYRNVGHNYEKNILPINNDCFVDIFLFKWNCKEIDQ